MLRVGLIGAGWIMPYHMRGWRAVAEAAEVVAVAEPDAEAREALAGEYEIPRRHDDYHELLADPEIDAVDIALPTALHAEATIAAARAGKHVLCEKPFACTAQQCREMIEAAQAAGIVLMPLHNRVFSPSIQETRRVLDEGRIGAPRFFRGSFLSGFYPRDNWRGKPQQSGGGVAIEAGVHLIYTAEHLVGRIASVNAHAARLVADPLAIEDSVVVGLRFVSGALGVITLGYGCSYFDDGCQVIGSEGAILVNGVEGQAQPQPVLQVYTAADDAWQAPPVDWSWEQSFVGIVEHFVRRVEGGAAPVVTAEDGLSAISVVEAIYRSTETGERVDVR
jgi:predicted dehydrogenase